MTSGASPPPGQQVTGRPSATRRSPSRRSHAGAFTGLRTRLRRARTLLEKSLLGRWLEHLLELQFVDRSVALAAKGLLALLPALVTVTQVAPEQVGRSLAQTVERRMGLSGVSLDLVQSGLTTSEPAAGVSTGLVTGLLTLFYATTFTSALRRLYLRAWRRPPMPDRWAHVKGLAWLGAVILLWWAADSIRSLLAGTSFEAWGVLLTVAGTVALWWCTSFLMLRGHVCWRVLMPSALLTAVGSGTYGLAAVLWMPRSIVQNGEQFGYFGVFMTVASWLVGLAFVVVAATALGPVLAYDRGRLGQLVRGPVDRVTTPGSPAPVTGKDVAWSR